MARAGWLGACSISAGSARPLDSIQGVAGAALCVEVFALTGPLQGGPGELAVLAVLRPWVAVGTSHATAAVMRRGPDWRIR